MADVRLPDGRIIRNVPDGVTQSELIARVQKADRTRRVDELKISNRGEFDPNSAEFQERFGATSASGAFENFAAGIGKAVVDTGRGLKQAGLGIADFIDPFDSEGLDSARAETQGDIDRARQRDDALLNTASGLTGNIVGNVGVGLAPGGIAGRGSAIARGLTNPQTFRTAAASGAAFGATQPVATGESRAFNAAAGAAGGVIGRGIAQPVSNSLSGAGRTAVDVLEDAGVPLDAAQRSGSNSLATVRRLLEDSPLSQGIDDFRERQSRGFTRAVLRTIGSDAEEATPEVMAAARNRIGRVFDDIAERSPARLDEVLDQRLSDILERAPLELPAGRVPNIQRQIRAILNADDGNGFIRGEQFGQIRQSLGRLSKQSDVGPIAREIQDELMDALARSSPLDSVNLQDAIEQFRNLRIIQNVIGKGEERFISPLRLSNSLSSRANQNLSVFGIGRQGNVRLAELARAGREVLPDTLGNSGTAGRQQIPTLAAIGAAGGAVAAGEPVTAAATLGLPFLLRAGLLSQGTLGRTLTGGVGGVPGAVLRQAPGAPLRTLQSQIFEPERF